jgi:hypothetical protein
LGRGFSYLCKVPGKAGNTRIAGILAILFYEVETRFRPLSASVICDFPPPDQALAQARGPVLWDNCGGPQMDEEAQIEPNLDGAAQLAPRHWGCSVRQLVRGRDGDIDALRGKPARTTANNPAVRPIWRGLVMEAVIVRFLRGLVATQGCDTGVDMVEMLIRELTDERHNLSSKLSAFTCWPLNEKQTNKWNFTKS